MRLFWNHSPLSEHFRVLIPSQGLHKHLLFILSPARWVEGEATHPALQMRKPRSGRDALWTRQLSERAPRVPCTGPCLHFPPFLFQPHITGTRQPYLGPKPWDSASL